MFAAGKLMTKRARSHGLLHFGQVARVRDKHSLRMKTSASAARSAQAGWRAFLTAATVAYLGTMSHRLENPISVSSLLAEPTRQFSPSCSLGSVVDSPAQSICHPGQETTGHSRRRRRAGEEHLGLTSWRLTSAAHVNQWRLGAC